MCFRFELSSNHLPLEVSMNFLFGLLFLILNLIFTSCGEIQNTKPNSDTDKDSSNSKITIQLRKPELKDSPLSESYKITDIEKYNLVATSDNKNCPTVNKEYKEKDKGLYFTLKLIKSCEYQMSIKATGNFEKKEILDPFKNPRIGYQTDIKPILEEHCTSCHKPRGVMQASPFTTLIETKIWINDIIIKIEEGSMPKNKPSLPRETSDKFKYWQNDNFPILPIKEKITTKKSNGIVCSSDKMKLDSLSSENRLFPIYEWTYKENKPN